jgi:hypothetical protein
MVGATAATAAGVTTSQATTITVNLLNNYISATGGNHLNADLTGDGHPDVTITGAKYSRRTIISGGGSPESVFSASVFINGVFARGYRRIGNPYSYMRLGSHILRSSCNCLTSSLTGSIPIFFKDLHINRGAPTKGFLEVTVTSTEIQLDSFTYNDPPTGRGATLPDQGSSLALLAIGAGGILALRRRRAAQGSS